jgi:hypothetical protein
MIMNSWSIAGLICGALFLAAVGTSSAGLIVNGDFEAGNSGFSSGYEYTADPGGLATGGEAPGQGAGRYGVGTDPNFFHPAFPSAGDHTSGSGNMMVVNGSGDASKIVWSGTVSSPLTIGATYKFSAWVMNVYPASPANLQFSFGGNILGTFSPTGLDQWQEFTAIFTATANQTSGSIDLNTEPFGNDFALDDIDLTKVPDGGLSVALLGFALVGVEGLRRKLSK